MRTPVKTAIIGCGEIALKLHAPDYDVSPDTETVALCDLKRAKAEDLQARYAPGARIYTDYKSLLKVEEVEAVSVCLPNCLHAQVTIDALRAGKHVLVEKPMAASLAEAKRMIAAAKKADRLLMVDQSQRLKPMHARAKEVLDSGIMGRVLHFHGMFGHGGPENWSPTGKWFFRKAEARFGAMADLGVHKADLVHWLTGQRAAEVGAFYERLEKKRTDVDDNFTATMRMEDGTIGTMSASWTAKGIENNFMFLFCEKGTLRINLESGKPLTAWMESPRREVIFDVPPSPARPDGAWGLDAGGKFARAIRGVEAPFCTAEEGLEALAVILAAERSADTRKTVKVAY